VSRSLQVATNASDAPAISARAAASIKPVLQEVSERLRRLRKKGGQVSTNVMKEIVRETVATARVQKTAAKLDGGPVISAGAVGAESRRASTLKCLVQAVNYLSELPDMGKLLANSSTLELRELARLPVAARRLTEVSAQYSAIRTTRTDAAPRGTSESMPID